MDGGGTNSASNEEGGENSESGAADDGEAPAKEGGTTAEAGATACNSANVVGSWEAAGTTGGTITLKLKSDGTFSEGFFVEPDAGSFEEEELTGTYMVSGGLMTFTTTEVTCPTPVPAAIVACGVADGDLFLDTNGTTVAWAPYTTPSNTGKITLGCGTPFKAYPLMAN